MHCIAVIGLGRMGLRHLQALHRLPVPVQLAALVRHDRDAARLAQLPFAGEVRPLASLDAVNRQAAMALVAVPTELHAEVAAQLQLPRVIEKPLCQSPLQASQILAATSRTFVGHTSRAEPGAWAMHAAIAAGQIGALRHIEIDWPEPQLLRPGAGLPQLAGRIFDVAVHALATVADALPQENAATAATLDAARCRLAGRLDWQNGVTAEVIVRADAGDRFVRAVGLTGELVWRVSAGKSQVQLRSLDGAVAELPSGGSDALTALWQAVLAAVDSGSRCPFDGQFGARVLQWSGQMLGAATVGNSAPFQWDWVR